MILSIYNINFFIFLIQNYCSKIGIAIDDSKNLQEIKASIGNEHSCSWQLKKSQYHKQGAIVSGHVLVS